MRPSCLPTRRPGLLRAWAHTWRVLLASALCTVLVACSVVQLAYNRAERLAYWWLDDKLHFTPEQSESVHASLADWLAWHRQTQLPLYAAWLARAQTEARGDITADLACQRRAQIEDLMAQSANAGAAHIARVAMTLSPRQLDRFERFLTERNEAFAETYLPDSEAQRQEAATTFVKKWVSFFYGDLHEAQEQALARQVRSFPMDAGDAQALRLHLQRRFMGLIRRLQAQQATPAQAEAAWREELAQAIAPSQPPWRERYARWYSAGCAAVATLHRSTDAQQRSRVVGQLRNWEIDARTLASQAAPTARQALLSAPSRPVPARLLPMAPAPADAPGS